MLKKKNIGDELEAVRVYALSVKRDKERKEKELVNIAWRLLKEGKLRAIAYGKICEKNNQLTV